MQTGYGVQNEMGITCITMSRICSACGKDGIGVTTQAGGSIRSCAPEKRRSGVHVSPQDVHKGSRESCLPEIGRAPTKTGWAETGQPNVRARWVAKEYKTHARPELYASTPPLEALKVVLSETATGELGRKVVAPVDVRRAYLYAPAHRRVFFRLPPEDYQPSDEHMRGLLRYRLYGTRHAQNWEEELRSALIDLKLTRESPCPCVWIFFIKCDDIVATAWKRHHNRWRTVGDGIPH